MNLAAGCRRLHRRRPAAWSPFAMMTTMATTSTSTIKAPDALRELRQRWAAAGRPAQKSIGWPRASWTAKFPEHTAMLNALPEPIGRADVSAACRLAAGSDDAAVEAFVVAMVWGYGSVGYGPWRTRRILDRNPDAAASLRRTAQIQGAEGAVEAYRFLANNGRLRYLGPAFATKFLHFVPQCGDGASALIHDALVSRAIRDLAGQRCSATRWSTPTYARYLGLVGDWADDLDLDPVDIEMLLFVSRAPLPWAESWVSAADA
ncbi:MAG: hypothetical protein CL424_17890 [Acidimicrobiaceae bacterium]|nr:hypothetical protein [Acidimicrobiaceae bacterium]